MSEVATVEALDMRLRLDIDVTVNTVTLSFWGEEFTCRTGGGREMGSWQLPTTLGQADSVYMRLSVSSPETLQE
jgi:hypothetical protein